MRHGLLSNERSGVAALEFALIVPIMVLMAIGVLDISRAVILWQEVYNAAHTIPLSASIVAVQSNRATALTPTQVQQQMSGVYAEIPWLADGIANGLRSVTLSSITYQPVPGCVPAAGVRCYTAFVTWSLAYPGGTGDLNLAQWKTYTRPCLPPVVEIHHAAAVPPTALLIPPQLAVIRTLDVASPDPMLVADVYVQYKPFFYGFITGNFDFWASGYWSARSADATKPPVSQYTTLSPTGAAGTCPGW